MDKKKSRDSLKSSYSLTSKSTLRNLVQKEPRNLGDITERSADQSSNPPVDDHTNNQDYVMKSDPPLQTHEPMFIDNG